MGIFRMTQGIQTGALYQPREVGWGEKGEGGSNGRGYMYTYGREPDELWTEVHDIVFCHMIVDFLQ